MREKRGNFLCLLPYPSLHVKNYLGVLPAEFLGAFRWLLRKPGPML
jgi:hypothetical protein